MKYNSNIVSIFTTAYGLYYVKEIIGLVILLLSLLNILINLGIRIVNHIKNKNYKAIPQEIEEATEELENIKNKEEE